MGDDLAKSKSARIEFKYFAIDMNKSFGEVTVHVTPKNICKSCWFKKNMDCEVMIFFLNSSKI